MLPIAETIIYGGGNVNMKKLFPVKKLSKEGLLEFVDKKGFYIVLILCIAIVGTTAVFLTTRNLDSSNSEYDPGKIISEDIDPYDMEVAQEEDDSSGLVTMESSTSMQEAAAGDQEAAEADNEGEDVIASTQPVDDSKAASDEVSEAEGKTEAKAEAKEESKTESKTTSKTASNTTNKSASAQTAKKTETVNFDMPVFGEVTQAFSNNKLLYSRTLEEWRVHTGVDIAADRGTPVKAAAKGVVTDVKSDPMYGITVIIEHSDGIKSVYCNLASDEMVVPNQKVEQGDVIGSVGNTAAFESLEQSHLHFEVWKNDVPVEPAEYLPKK